MLGRRKRTSRLDVALGLAFSGIAYLVWSLVAGANRLMVRDVIHWSDLSREQFPIASKAVRVVFVEAGPALDVAGVVWLAVSLLLVVYASRQKFSISAAFVSALLQSFVAALGGVWVAWAIHLQYRQFVNQAMETDTTILQQISGFSLGVSIVIAVGGWLAVLAWLLRERRRYERDRGPSLTDGLRTNIYK